jgi:hypothetical protein
MSLAVVTEEKVERTVDLDEGRSMERLRRYIDNPPENSRIFTITPGMAAIILRERNHGNRPKKPMSILKYARHMSQHTWALTGDTIKFGAPSNQLRDGQNRLMACVRAGVPFRTHVVFGIDDGAFDLMDQGKNRDAADILMMAGHSNANTIAAAVRWAYLIDSGRAKQRDTLEPSETKRLLETKYPTISEHLQQARAITSTTGQPTSLIVAMLYLFRRANAAKGAEFADAWESGKWVGPKYKPIQTMQAKISALQAAASGRVHDVIRAALIINAWNAFVEGRKGTINEIEWNRADDFPAIKG